MPPTLSPSPFSSELPRRISGPRWTVRPSFRSTGVPGFVHESVFIDPAHACRVRTDDRIDTLRQHAAHGAQILDNTRPRPINVRPVLENHIDERFAEHGFATNELHFRRGDEACRNRV